MSLFVIGLFTTDSVLKGHGPHIEGRFDPELSHNMLRTDSVPICHGPIVNLRKLLLRPTPKNACTTFY